MPAPQTSTFRPRVSEHLLFILYSGLLLMLLCTLLRATLLAYNHELIGSTPSSVFVEAFINGMRFDLRLIIYILAPLILALSSSRAMAARRVMRLWLTAMASVLIFLGMLELDFYREFHQRLNSLIFQYMSEDPKTVASMLWYGFPVLRYTLFWIGGTCLLFFAFRWIDRHTRWTSNSQQTTPWYFRFTALFLCLIIAVVAARGTLRQGPPLRWGDAFTTSSIFANHLGLNGALTLFKAAEERFSTERSNVWQPSMSEAEALETTRKLLLTPHDALVDPSLAAVRRDFTPPSGNALPIKNVVVILMESFAGHYVGALGSSGAITPYFDALTEEGLLFTRFFSSGTHTHQGMFATMACFPNLPGFEYLMQTPEGAHQFSGLPQLLSARGFNDVYVYNGDFAWDNQSGFFSNQGMTTFIGRHDFVDPVVSDPTWGVSDQDMFARGHEELIRLHSEGKPFYALLQSLSNHTPYALPENLPVEPVTDSGSTNEHLTAMRYSDWALGKFFEAVRQSPYYHDTLFVIVGDHGFGSHEQLTEMDLHRFNVPLLLIAPGMRDKFGERIDTVGTQPDIVPTIMGILGGKVRHQCWGRDLLSLPVEDRGFGVIKPSGSDQNVAIIDDDRILIKPDGLPSRLYRYRLGAAPAAEIVSLPEDEKVLGHRLEAFIQAATQSLLNNTTGVNKRPDQ